MCNKNDLKYNKYHLVVCFLLYEFLTYDGHTKDLIEGIFDNLLHLTLQYCIEREDSSSYFLARDFVLL